jgi:NAD(P)-dependent dehydrogenase (short-subunit alcohol dehydrogenase family)/nitroreductase
LDLGLAGAATLVAGGTQGMGLATAECLAADRAKVAVLARSRSDLDRVSARLLELGAAEAVPLAADVTSAAEVTAAFAQITERWGELNVLVNTVGPRSGLGRFEDLSDRDWLAAIDEGAMGMVRCVRAVLPLLRRADWARIVNISAHSTKRQSESLVAYTAAKAMVTSITKNLSLALAEDEILVNTVSPGTFATESLAGWARTVGIDPDDPYALMAGIAERFGHPAHLPRAGVPSEIGAVIAFVASRRNSYMTGANIRRRRLGLLLMPDPLPEPADWPVSADTIGLLEGMATTRAIRRYRDEPVPAEVLRDVLFAATRAPSGSNRQPFRFLVLTDGAQAAAAKKLIGDAARRIWEGKRESDGYDRGSGAVDESPKTRMARTMQQFVDEFERVPVLILPCLVRYRAPTPSEGASIYPACQNLLLAARALGYGGAFTGWNFAVDKELRQLLTIPDQAFVAGTITLGRPAGHHGPVRRRPMAELVYDGSWGRSPAWAVDPPGTRFTAAGPPSGEAAR